MSRELLLRAVEALTEADRTVTTWESAPQYVDLVKEIRTHLDNTTTIGDKTYVQQGGYLMGGVKELGDFRPLQYNTKDVEPYAWSYTSKINGEEVLTHQPPDRVIEPEQFHMKPLYLSPTIPPGMVLVPEEPTEAMLKAGRKADWEWLEVEPDDVFESGLVAIYKAMLAAAKKGEK
jgi:hypothetical protein